MKDGILSLSLSALRRFPRLIKMSITLLILATILWCASVSYAQTEDDPFFPLEISNEWTYFKTYHFPPDEPDTLWGPIFRISETVTVKDTAYYVAPHPFAIADTLRTNDGGLVWARHGGRDVLLFDFSLAEGETYTFPFIEPGQQYEVTIERDLTVSVGAGRFDDCVRLTFDVPGAMDAARSFTFAPGVGIVQALGSHGDYEELYSAVVGGRVVSVRDDGVPHRPHFISAFPNPFCDAVTMIAPADAGHPAELRVFDMLGREVAVLTSNDCSEHTCRFEWRSDGHPAGHYFARVEFGSQMESVSMVLVR